MTSFCCCSNGAEPRRKKKLILPRGGRETRVVFPVVGAGPVVGPGLARGPQKPLGGEGARGRAPRVQALSREKEARLVVAVGISH